MESHDCFARHALGSEPKCDVVAEYLTELTDAHGWNDIEKMTASELIRAVADLGPTSSAADSGPADARR